MRLLGRRQLPELSLPDQAEEKQMIDGGYEFGEPFQRRLLSLLVKHPTRGSRIIEARYFTSPLFVDIGRVALETFKKHPDARLTRTTLEELVKASLHRKARQNWPLYKKEIKAVFRLSLPDKPVLLEKAAEFAKEARYRDALVRAERQVTSRDYEAVHQVFEEVRASVNGAMGRGVWKWADLPHPSDYPFKEVDWLVEGLIPAESAIAISGEEGVGKTIFALSMARALTEGTEFLGKRAWMAPVLYLGLDVSQVTLQNYIKMMRWTPNEMFRILTMWTGENMQPPMLDDPKGMEPLYELAKQNHPVMVFDTLRDFFGGEENSSTETKPVVDAIRKLRAAGATIVLLVHPPKSGKSIIRGTGNISQKVDIPYLLEKDRWRGKEIGVFTCPKKNRFGSTSFRMPMQIQFIPMPAGTFLRLREVKDWEPSEHWKKREADVIVIQYVREHPGTNQKGIQAALRMGDRSVRSALYGGKEQGLLRSAKGDRNELHWFAVEYEEDVNPKEGMGSADEEELAQEVLETLA
jgi:archaellum biogenesis ATPase FlaH